MEKMIVALLLEARDSSGFSYLTVIRIDGVVFGVVAVDGAMVVVVV